MELDKIKAGDQIAIKYHNYGSPKYFVSLVSKVTKTQVIAGRRRFKLENGVQIGGAEHEKGRIIPITDEIRRLALRQHNLAILEKIRFRDLSDEVLDATASAYCVAIAAPGGG